MPAAPIATAAQDLGLFTRRQALADGYEAQDVEDRLRCGEWVRLQRGVYLDGGVEVTPLHRAAAALLVAGDLPGAVASHQTAARVHDLGPVRPTRLDHLTMPPSRRPPRPGPLVVHHDILGPDDTTLVAGLPITTPLRTVLDLLIGADTATAVWACEKAMRDGVFGGAALLDELAWFGTRARRRAEARFALVDLRSESPLETAARLLLREHGLPPPVPQYPVQLADGTRYRLDLAYPSRQLALELDGRQWHSTFTATRADQAREHHLTAHNWRILRFTWQDIFDHPDDVIAKIQSALT
jgi:very-short-patch-repair endonuclease